MLHTVVNARWLVAMIVSCAVGVWGLHAYPFDTENVFLALIQLQNPSVFRVLAYGYTTLWFTTPFLATSLLTSLLALVVYRRPADTRLRALPAYPHVEDRQAPYLVLGERHFATQRGRAPDPLWLSIPQRGLYTGVIVVGAVGTGKTSAAMYPFADQLLRWKAADADRKLGGLVLEVKGDFCGQVRDILTRAGRGDDYVEIGLGGNVCYNPLHNDLDPYALAFAIGSLLNNLHGRSNEPFWQQAYTDLVKFVILLRRLAHGYTTLSDVYRAILDEQVITTDLEKLSGELSSPPEVIIIRSEDYHTQCAGDPRWPHWFAEDTLHHAHPFDAALDSFVNVQHIPSLVRPTMSEAWKARKQQYEAVDRWYKHGWGKLDQRLRSNIKEGIIVFLSLFDADPVVHRTFCPPAEAYAKDRPPDGPRPLPPLEDLLERGCVLALNFPVAMNPGLARALGVLLKLDFQRAVLRRIPLIAAQPARVWRDLLFVCDEYHAFATVGETQPTGDERAFALSRQARLIPIVATQSISSLRSALPGEESWRTLLQCFRTKLFLATSDEFTARTAADLCGRRDKLKAQYTLSEAGQGTHISLLTGRATATRHTLSASKSYTPHHEYIFPSRVFTELQNAQAVALPYDGVNPQEPQFCYLKPHYLDVQTSYFDHLAQGRL
jgi:TraM recognition site of TraD and TraG